MFSHVILWVTPGNSEKILEKWRVGVLSRVIWLNLGQNQGNSLIFTKIAISQIDIFWTSRVPRMPKFGICNVPSGCSKRYLGFYQILIFWPVFGIKMSFFCCFSSIWPIFGHKMGHFSQKNQKQKKSKITILKLSKTITHTKFDLYNYYRSPDNVTQVFLKYRDFRKNKGISLILAQI